MPPRVSVCIASYNHAPFVRTAVESVLDQTYGDWELIVTDDGSRDETFDILRRFDDPRIHVERFPENRGACVALNHSIGRARGEFIAILNSDDAWQTDKLALQVDVLESRPEVAAVFTHAEAIDEKGLPLQSDHFYRHVFAQQNRSRQAWLGRLLLGNNCLCHPSVLVRSSTYRDLGLYDPGLTQLPDLDMWVRVCCHSEIWVVQRSLTRFRVLDGERNASGNRLEPRIRDEWETMIVWRKALQMNPREVAGLLEREGTPGDAGLATPQRVSGDTLAGMRPGARAAALLWLYESLRDTADTRQYQAYSHLTQQGDAFGVRERERLSRKGRSLLRRIRLPWFRR